MKDRPLLMSGSMVRAYFAGLKTQTRRVVDLTRLKVRLPSAVSSELPGCKLTARPGVYSARLNPQDAVTIEWGSTSLGVKPGEFHFVCPYADGETHLGDYGGRKRWTITPHASRLWIRETWRTEERDSDAVDGIRFAADDSFSPIENNAAAAERWIDAHENGRHGEKWRPSIFMRHWMSRALLDVVSVRIERLQEITEHDARSEGVPALAPGEWSSDQCLTSGECAYDSPHRSKFAELWDELNSDRGYSWKSNPRVWRIEFSRYELAPAEARA